MSLKKSIEAYQSGMVQTEVNHADSHALVGMLLSAALKNIKLAKGFMKEKQIAPKAEKLSKAVDIISALKSSLDFEHGGEVAERLESLYEYSLTELTLANANNDIEKLNVIIEVLTQIESGWSGIREEAMSYLGLEEESREEK